MEGCCSDYEINRGGNTGIKATVNKYGERKVKRVGERGITDK